MNRNARYTVRAVTTPLPSAKPEEEIPTVTESYSTGTSVRLQNEDDDLYDPYSDFHDGTLKPLTFEEDPWN